MPHFHGGDTSSNLVRDANKTNHLAGNSEGRQFSGQALGRHQAVGQARFYLLPVGRDAYEVLALLDHWNIPRARRVKEAA